MYYCFISFIWYLLYTENSVCFPENRQKGYMYVHTHTLTHIIKCVYIYIHTYIRVYIGFKKMLRQFCIFQNALSIYLCFLFFLCVRICGNLTFSTCPSIKSFLYINGWQNKPTWINFYLCTIE